MSRKPISMRKVKEILRLKHECGLSERQIADSCKLGRTTVQEYFGRIRASKITWEQAQKMPEDELEKILFPGNSRSPHAQPLPEWEEVHSERRKPGVTLQLLWEEYRGKHPDGFGYSRFCELYQGYVNTIDVRMRQTHKAGEKLFVDFSGTKAEIIDRMTGEIRQAEIFVAVLGASNYTYIEATWTQSLQDWIGAHVRVFEFLGGVPALLVPDNLKSAVKRACYYDPDENPTFAAMAEHYGTAVLPARPYKARDKAKVEGGVLLAQRWILARLRHHQFFTLAELNTAIRQLLVSFNQRPFKKLSGSRESAFEKIDKPALRPLPPNPFEFAHWKNATVNIDYHVEYEHHYYSVPYQHVHQKVQIRATANIVEVFLKGQKIASHVRCSVRGKHSTLPAHMPPKHQFGEWTPGRFLNWALKWGPNVLQVIKTILESKQHPEQGFRACRGIIRLGQKVGPERLEAACERAIYYRAVRYKTIQSILENGQEYKAIPVTRELPGLPAHTNIRGPGYFQTLKEEDDDASPTNH